MLHFVTSLVLQALPPIADHTGPERLLSFNQPAIRPVLSLVWVCRLDGPSNLMEI